jgi:hypothetical protein
MRFHVPHVLALPTSGPQLAVHISHGFNVAVCELLSCQMNHSSAALAPHLTPSGRLMGYSRSWLLQPTQLTKHEQKDVQWKLATHTHTKKKTKTRYVHVGAAHQHMALILANIIQKHAESS